MPRLSRYDGFSPSKQEREAFDCGREELNGWLVRFAGQATANRDAVVFLLHEGRDILGFFSLSAGSVSRAQAGAKLGKRAPEPVPLILVGRMAVDARFQGAGWGAELLRQATLRALASADGIGARGIMLHAVDEPARSFYQHHGFEESAISPRLMFLSFADVAETLRAVGEAGVLEQRGE